MGDKRANSRNVTLADVQALKKLEIVRSLTGNEERERLMKGNCRMWIRKT